VGGVAGGVGCEQMKVLRRRLDRRRGVGASDTLLCWIHYYGMRDNGRAAFQNAVEATTN